MIETTYEQYATSICDRAELIDRLTYEHSVLHNSFMLEGEEQAVRDIGKKLLDLLEYEILNLGQEVNCLNDAFLNKTKEPLAQKLGFQAIVNQD